MEYLKASATISPCGLYRYDLVRLWEPAGERVAFCMLNPSTADGTRDDPTIRRCVGFAREWGYGSLVVVNLFAFRATEPDELRLAIDPVGPENDTAIERHGAKHLVVCAWGTNPAKFRRPVLRERPGVVLQLLGRVGAVRRHLGLSGGNHPKHPLYLKANTPPQPFKGL